MEPIKQEIINNIFENGDKLITGPILQTVLIDMIDDVNVKDQEILSKTGSWDDAATQIPNLATKEEVTNLSESVARDLENVVGGDLTGYATEQWVQDQGYLTEHQDISGLATKTELNAAKDNLQGNITSLSESVARDIANVSVPEGVATEAWVQSQDYANKSYVDNAVSSVDLTGYATETWVESQGYLKEHQDISNLATKGELNDTKNTLQGNITSLSESVARDLTGYATETWVQDQGYLTEHQDISGLATKAELTSVSQSVQTDITNLSESVANSAVWKKGTGEDSIVQAIANGTDQPTAPGKRAIATGQSTNASGQNSHAEGGSTEAKGYYSHAEGYSTEASGWYNHAEGMYTSASGEGSHAEGSHTKAEGNSSHAEGGSAKALGSNSHAEGSFAEALGKASHAEGYYAVASGSYSHAEGDSTKTSNDYEHAQGRYNYTSSNQIFSIGTGNSETDRRNAVSVLEVDNSGSYTGSFFVQNIGGYDGTNPEPGTNDLATVINNLPSGGSSETLWKKGEGQDSIVQKLTGANEVKTPQATGTGSIATGNKTTASANYSHAEGESAEASGLASHAEGAYANASGPYSHAEGEHTTTSGYGSHAEGMRTTTSGAYSHAEGRNTKTSNQFEHAQGRYNHNSENQIFSIGTGNSETDRRNAVSVLEVSNNNSYTSSFFVQNIGGYDGTNPEPGTNDLATVINNLPSGGGSSETLWKKGTGKDSIVQILTGDDEAYTPTATGKRAIAVGFHATASGDNSYAEGNSTASGSYSHAEGHGTLASGIASHAEGYYTTASNTSEHAQGRFNHSSENQIFSVGAGEWGDISNVQGNRRNAISVLAVPNPETQINTASVFVQNVGGYDGTNPLPGTNDLATVINGMSSGGGSSETLWEKGEGTDSIVQAITDGTNLLTATGTGSIATGLHTSASANYSHAEGQTTVASGVGSHAEGYDTGASREGSHAEGFRAKASGMYSHAEGYGTNASGNSSHAEGSFTKASNNYSHAEGRNAEASGMYSHAEGHYTTASEDYSHAEGFHTVTSNDYEHAQGKYNCTSSNQIFSVGAGESIKNPDTQVVTETRRNALSVLAVPNTDTKILTSSFFVQNIGGYDGTNPLPGTNDLATVLNNTETWTFTLEDGSTVTKTIRIS